MTETNPQTSQPVSREARLADDSIDCGWFGRGFRFGPGFVLA